jgi:hypothetical protein
LHVRSTTLQHDICAYTGGIGRRSIGSISSSAWLNPNSAELDLFQYSMRDSGSTESEDSESEGSYAIASIIRKGKCVDLMKLSRESILKSLGTSENKQNLILTFWVG